MRGLRFRVLGLGVYTGIMEHVGALIFHNGRISEQEFLSLSIWPAYSCCGIRIGFAGPELRPRVMCEVIAVE